MKAIIPDHNSFSIQSIFRLVALILFAWAMRIPAIAQNINGEKIIVGKESITIINFPGDVLNIDFGDQDAYDYYTVKRREMKSVSIQFNRTKATGPNTSLLVNEGGRSHMFLVAFDPDYDINDNSRPPLWYDHSNLKELKKFVAAQKEMEHMSAAQVAQRQQQQEAQAAALKQQEYAAAQKQREAAATVKEQEIKLAKAKEEAEQRAAAAALKRAKDAAAAKAQEAQLAKNKEEAAQKHKEHEALTKKLAALEAQQQEQEASKQYSLAGLWRRYGSKGINLYDIPTGQMSYLNADFYDAKDTAAMSMEAQRIIGSKVAPPLNLQAENKINNGVQITLEHIEFKNAHVYYKLKVDNNTGEDFLMGKTFMYWYDNAQQPRLAVNCSYMTYIAFFPLIKPGEHKDVVFVTRLPNVAKDESLVLFTEDRRSEKGSTSIVIPGNVYNMALNRNTEPVTKGPDIRNTGTQQNSVHHKKDKQKKHKKHTR